MLRRIQDNDQELKQQLTDLGHPCYFEYAQLGLKFRVAYVNGNDKEMEEIRKAMVTSMAKYDLSKAIVPIKSLVNRIAAGENEVVDFMMVELLYQIKSVMDETRKTGQETDSSTTVLTEAIATDMTEHFYENFFVITPSSRKRFANGHPGMFGLLLRNAISDVELDPPFVEHLRKVHANMKITKAEKDAFKAAFQMTLNEEHRLNKHLKARMKAEIDRLIGAVFDSSVRCKVS